MVRIVVTVIVASLVGFFLGKTQLFLTTNGLTERFQTVEPTGSTATEESTSPRLTGNPKVELPDGNTFEFEQMRHGSSMSHAFKVRNVGEGLLRLVVSGSTCKCTVGDLAKNELLPGEETEVNLTWRGQKVAAAFGQSATVKTNDPENPELQFRIEGSVIDSFVFEPTEIDLGDFGPEASFSKEFTIYCYADKDVELSELRWSRPEIADFIALKYQEIEVDPAGRHAKAHRVYQATLEIQEGMPVGLISSSIAFLTNYSEEVDPLEIKVHGRVTSDLSLIGGTYYQAERNFMNIGKVSSKTGFSTSLWIVLRGDQREGFEVTVEQLDAKDSLEVTVGEPNVADDRTLVPIQFNVPLGAPNAYYPGNTKDSFAKVIIRSNSSKLPELPIRVKLLIEDN